MFNASKKLGQNWLINPSIHKTIVEAAEISATDTVLEIGPGTGLLTEHLVKTGGNLIAIEKDRRLIPALQAKFKNQKNVHPVKSREAGTARQLFDRVNIVEDDILQFDPEKYKLKEDNYKLVGNIPYYLTSHLLKKILTEWPRPKLILFMVQKEVAKRITARPPEMNLLGLSVQLYADAKVVKNVSKENFYPVPKVDSALIKILPKEQTPAEKLRIEKILKLARLAFRGKRKQILNSLSSGLKVTRTGLGQRLEEAGINPKRRPETLTLDEWTKLNQILS